MAIAAPAAPAAGPTVAPVAEAPKQKKKGKLFLIIGLVVLLLAGTGGGAWFYMKQKSAAEAEHAAASDDDDDEDRPTKKAKASKKKKKRKPVELLTQFVPLEPAFTVNLSGEDRDRFLQAGLVLEVSDSKVPDLLKAKMPLIRSEVLYLLSSKGARELLTLEGKKALANAILEIARKPLDLDPPENGIEAVHFSTFVVQ